MSDLPTGSPIDPDGPGDQGGAVQGMRGERTRDPGAEHPEQRRTIETSEGPIEVEDVSGTAYAEATGAMDANPPDPEADGGQEDNSFPVNARP